MPALAGSTGDGAVASRALPEGAVLALKQWIDRRWMRGYTSAANGGRDADAMRCGGCAAKVPATLAGSWRGWPPE